MTDEATAYLSPGCDGPVEPGEDYVVALEHDDEPGLSLHEMRSDTPVGAEQRFHVEHSEGGSATACFALVDEPSPSY